ncbi:MAG: DUF2058 domain-containing protein [Pseudomonadales bacterium]
MASLQDQLLKAGLVDKKKAKQADKDKRKQKKVQRKSKEGLVDETKQQAQQALADKAQRDRELALKQNAQAEKKAIRAQIKQLIELNRQAKGKGDVAFNFTDQSKIKRIYVSDAQQKELSNGRLVVVSHNDDYELIPAQVADKIAQRDDSSIVMRNAPLSSSSETIEEDDPYADYQIPDDLMW